MIGLDIKEKNRKNGDETIRENNLDIKKEGRKNGDEITIYSCKRLLSNGKWYIYIGSSKNYDKRKKNHKKSSKKFEDNKDVETGCVFVMTCEGKLLKEGNSLKEYNWNVLHKFIFSTQENASKIEQAYIDMHNVDPNYKVMNLVRANFNSSKNKDIQKHYTRLLAGLHYEHNLEIGNDEIYSLFTELGYCDLKENDGISAALKNYLGVMSEYMIGEGIKRCGDKIHFNCTCGRSLTRNVHVYTNILTGKPSIFGEKCVMKAISSPKKTCTIMDTLKAAVNSIEIQKNIIKNKENTNKQSESRDDADTNPKNPNSQPKTNSTTNEDYITRPEEYKRMMVKYGYQLAIDLANLKLKKPDISQEECDEINKILFNQEKDIKWLENKEERTQKNIESQIHEVNNLIIKKDKDLRKSKKKTREDTIKNKLNIGKSDYDEWEIKDGILRINKLPVTTTECKSISKNKYKLSVKIGSHSNDTEKIIIEDIEGDFKYAQEKVRLKDFNNQSVIKK